MGLAGPVETTLLGAEWVGRLGSAIRVTNHDQMSHPGDSCIVTRKRTVSAKKC